MIENNLENLMSVPVKLKHTFLSKIIDSINNAFSNLLILDYIKNKTEFDTNNEEIEIKITKNLIKKLKKEDEKKN